MADQRLRATPAQLQDALGACTELNPVYRRVKMTLEGLQMVEQQIAQLDQEMASLLRQHQDAVERLAVVPRLGVDSAQQFIAEVVAQAATFPSAEKLSSWVGACPGEEERGREPQPTLAEGQPPDASRSQSSSECCCQTQSRQAR